jgi:hypothetical protein
MTLPAASLKWIALALLGLAVAAAVAIAASNLVSRQIGLASEPISAGRALAPAASSNRGQGSSSSGRSGDHSVPTVPTTTPETTTPATTPTAPTTTDDRSHSSDEHGSDGDDD